MRRVTKSGKPSKVQTASRRAHASFKTETPPAPNQRVIEPPTLRRQSGSVFIDQKTMALEEEHSAPTPSEWRPSEADPAPQGSGRFREALSESVDAAGNQPRGTSTHASHGGWWSSALPTLQVLAFMAVVAGLAFYLIGPFWFTGSTGPADRPQGSKGLDGRQTNLSDSQPGVPSAPDRSAPLEAARVTIPKAAMQVMAEQRTEFHVQAGAFNVREYARVLVRQLNSRGYAGVIVKSADGPRHRVWVGGNLDRSAAETLISRLRASGFGAILIPAVTSLSVQYR